MSQVTSMTDPLCVEEYIKMCEGSKLQELKTQDNMTAEDIFVSKEEFKEKHRIEREGLMYGAQWFRHEHTWVPRQHQLQEIVNGKLRTDVGYLLQHFYRFCFINRYRDGLPAIYFLHTMDELWHALAVKEMYDQVWGGKEWVTTG